MTHTTTSRKSLLKSSVSAFALGLVLASGLVTAAAFETTMFAFAAEGDGNGQGGQGKGGGDDHDHGDGDTDDHDHDDGDADDHDHDDSTKGKKGGHDAEGDDGDSEGGQGAKGGDGGGKPIWASEGLEETDLGRLNIARSPAHVLDRAYEEALSIFTAEMAEFYDMTLAEAIDALANNFDATSFLDSPVQSLAMLRDALDGDSILNTLPGVSNDVSVLAAMFLGAASDKTAPITPLVAYNVAAILGFELTEAEAIALAADAEAVRVAILEGHG